MLRTAKKKECRRKLSPCFVPMGETDPRPTGPAPNQGAGQGPDMHHHGGLGIWDPHKTRGWEEGVASTPLPPSNQQLETFCKRNLPAGGFGWVMLVLNGKGGGVELQPHIHHHHHHLQLGGFHSAWLGGGQGADNHQTKGPNQKHHAPQDSPLKMLGVLNSGCSEGSSCRVTPRCALKCD